MNKGFGLYSPHEATTFFLKTMLVSFWIGVDLIAVLVMSTFSPSTIAQHGGGILMAGGVLIAGTVFSGLFAWATGSLFAKPSDEELVKGVRQFLWQLKREPVRLLGAGMIAVSVLTCAMAGYVHTVQKAAEAQGMTQLGRANVALGKKCAEVARLESALFRSDEQFVMAQCLIQYDQQYASLRETARGY